MFLPFFASSYFQYNWGTLAYHNTVGYVAEDGEVRPAVLVYLEALLDEVVKDEEDEEQLRGEQQIVTVLRVLQQLDDLDVLDTEMK